MIIDRLGHACLLLFDSLYQKDQKEKQTQGSYLKKKLEEPQPSYFYDNVCAHNILYPKSIHDPSDTQTSYHLQSQYHFLDRLHLQIMTLFHVEHRKIMAAKLTNQIFTLFLFQVSHFFHISFLCLFFRFFSFGSLFYNQKAFKYHF